MLRSGRTSGWSWLLWLSRGCIEKGGEGGLDNTVLRVRVGLITRTETVPLGRDNALGRGTRDRAPGSLFRPKGGR